MKYTNHQPQMTWQRSMNAVFTYVITIKLGGGGCK